MKRIFYNFIYPVYLPLFYIFIIVTTSVFGLFAIIISFIPGLDPKANFSYKVNARSWAWMNLAITGTRVKVKGKENIERKRSYIVMSNHQSHFDVWALISRLPLQLRFVMKMELRKIPIFGLGCERLGMIYVNRLDSDKSHKSIEEARKKVEAGVSVLFFPEGTRSPDGNLLKFKKGGVVMAINTNTPILPITINGSRFALPKDHPLKMKPGKIEMLIHEPIEVKGLNYEDRNRLLEEIREIIEGSLDMDYGKLY